MDFQASPIVRAIQSVLFQVLSLFLLSFIFPFPFLTSTLQGQNQNPVAVRDTASTQNRLPVTVNVVQNDYDPDGDTIRIKSALNSLHGKVIHHDDSTITYLSNYFVGRDSVKYKIEDTYGNYSDYTYLVVEISENPHLPLAQNDVSTTPSAVPIFVNLLLNDTDPDGDSLEIDPTSLTHTGNSYELTQMSDSIIRYQPLSTFIGPDQITYHVRKKNNPTLISNTATLLIQVTENPEIPVAINDTVDYQSFSQINIDVLANDINPTGEPVEIFDFQNFYSDSITPDGKIYYCNSLWNMDHLSKEFEYRIRLVNHPEYASDWARVVVNYLPDSSFFFARKDSARVFMHKPTRINLLKNDYFVNPQDTIVLINPVVLGSWYGKILEKDDSTVTYQADPYGQNDGVEIIYTLRQKGAQLPTLSSVQVAHVICLEEPFAFLDLNNIKARINPFGNLFNTFTTPSRGFFVPKNSTQSPVFISSLWLGGLDEQELLHFAGEQYRISGYSGSMRAVEDFWAGPVSDTTQYDPVYDSLWNRVWKFEGWEVEHYKHHWTDPGYWPPDNIRTWPAHGNPALGETKNLAPFFDNNGDGVYNAFDGDYPGLYGHQCIFFLFNDFIKPNRESKGKRLGVEIHGWAYAFNLPQDSAFWNTSFFHYDIYNRSPDTYYNMYIGNFTDLDIGWAYDDFMMCDVERNMMIGYNADYVDGEGQIEAYGEFPPA